MKPQRGPIAILFACLVIVMLGFGIVMPLMPFYVTHFGASGSALGLMMALYSLMQFVFAPIWGRLSDRIGRKPVLLIGIAGFAISFMLQGLSQNLFQFILARTLAGILSSAALPTAMAYAADTSSEKDRSGAMGMMGAAMGLGMIFGPLLGGVLTHVQLPLPAGLAGLLQTTVDATTGQTISLSVPYLAAALLALAALPLIIAFLPESLSAASRREIVHSKDSQLRQLTGALRGPLAFLYVMAFLLTFALANMESVLGLYAKDNYGMGPSEVGVLLGAIGVLSVLQQGILIRPLTHRIGEGNVLKSGLVVGIAGMLGLALLRSPAGLVISAAVFTLGNSLLWPSVSSLISQRATTGQGAALGLAQSFQSLGRAAGPLWAGAVYDINPAFPFLSGALMQAFALLVGLRVMGRPAGAAQTSVAQTGAAQTGAAPVGVASELLAD